MNISDLKKQDNRVALFIATSAVISVIIQIIGIFLPYPASWGFHFLAFLPLTFKICIPLLMIMFLIPGFQLFILKKITILIDFFKSKKKGIKVLLLLSFFILTALILWELREKFFLIGDGSLIIRIVDSQQLGNIDISFFLKEPLSGYIIIVLSKLISGAIGNIPIENAIQIGIILIVPIYISLSWKLVSILIETPVERVLLLGIIVSSGTFPMLFGYIETYIILYLGILLYIYSSIKYLKGNLSLIVPFAMFGIIFCLHFGTIIFLPTIGYFIYHNMHKFRGKEIPSSIFVMILTVVLILWYLNYPFTKFIELFSGIGKRILISDVSENEGYGFFSFYHLVNILNFFILMGLFCFEGIIFFKSFYRRENVSKPMVLFLLIFSLMSLIFVILFRSEIGISRDWDVLAIFFTGFTIANLWFLVMYINDPLRRQKLMVIIFGITILQSSSFVILNSHEISARTRFETLIDNRWWPKSGLISAYEELSIYHRGRKELDPAIKYLKQIWDIDSTNPRIAHSIAHIYSLMKDQENVIYYLKRALAMSPDDWEIYVELASAYGSLGKHEEAIYHLQKAQILKPQSAEVNYGMGVALLNLTKDCAQASKYFTHAIELDPYYADAYAGLAYCCARQNDMAGARRYKKKYFQLKKQSELIPEIAVLLESIQ